jgi:hypothetical protein
MQMDFSAYYITVAKLLLMITAPGWNEQAVALRLMETDTVFNCNLLVIYATYYTWGGRGTEDELYEELLHRRIALILFLEETSLSLIAVILILIETEEQ